MIHTTIKGKSRLIEILEEHTQEPVRLTRSSSRPVTDLFDTIAETVYLWVPQKKLLILKDKCYRVMYEVYIAEEVEKLGIEVRYDFE